MKKRNAKECQKLFISELVTTGICAYIIYALSGTLETGLDIRLLIPGAILIFVLLQGVAYWHYRKEDAAGEWVDRTQTMAIFKGLRTITPVILAIYPLFLLYLLLFNAADLWVPFNLFGVILCLFAGIEYINDYYFSVRIGNFKKRIPSDLAMELADHYPTRRNSHETID